MPDQRVVEGDCLTILRSLPPASYHAMVSDQPYGLGEAPPDVTTVLQAWLSGKTAEANRRDFLGRDWELPGPDVWAAARHRLVPGAHGIIFASPRTVDLTGIALRLAGFEVRDLLAWHHGTGLGAGHDISRDLDRLAGVQREVVGSRVSAFGDAEQSATGDGRHLWGQPATRAVSLTGGPVSEVAKRWAGWRARLRPAFEPMLLVRNPLPKGATLAINTLEYGTGTLNVRGFAEGDEYPTSILMDDPVFHCAKPSRAEKEAGCEHLPLRTLNRVKPSGMERDPAWAPQARHNPVICAKPISLFTRLLRLLVPPGGSVLDPYCGAAPVGVACATLDFDYLGIDSDPVAIEVARARLARARNAQLDQPTLFAEEGP